ncbi:MAG: hypothetical protein ACWGQW_03125 [bacterium]
MSNVTISFYLGYEIKDGDEVLKKEECYGPIKGHTFTSAYFRVCRDLMDIINDYLSYSREREAKEVIRDGRT